MNPTITIDMDRKCEECREGGAVASGLCLSCTSRAMNGKPMKTETGRLVQLRFNNLRRDGRRAMAAARRK